MPNNFSSALERILKNNNSSFESEKLLNEIQTDIFEFGATKKVAVFIDSDNFIKDYDFNTSKEEFIEQNEQEPEFNDIKDSFWGEYKESDIYVMTLSQLLALVEIQNMIIKEPKIIERSIMSKNASKGGSSFWKNLSPEERSRIARERGKAGAKKRWGDKNKDK